MDAMKNMSDKVRGSLIPQLYILRRVPMRYRHVLPLEVIKRFQCIVVGSAPGVLTVGITDRQNTLVIESLKEFTGQAIFPVLIDPTRMQLLIQRIERNDYWWNTFYSRANGYSQKMNYYQYSLIRFQVGSIVTLLASQRKIRL